MGLLETIQGPEDLRRLPAEDLPRLAAEIREEIVRVCAQNGGHLAPSLGVVELTLVLHRVFQTPRDRIVWDIGHQAYAHKLVTGRRDRFHTLRQWGGLSGFLRRQESPYDTFGAGHSSTSISAALGMAVARDLAGEDYHVVAVIGDGAMTAGMAYEALNNAGHLKRDLIVILNDNEMSISPNVGAISAYLSRIMTGQVYTRLRKDAESLLKTIPGVGESVIKVAKTLEEGIKGLVGPGILFEEMGFTYVGPIDGHRFDTLTQTLENVKRLKGPVLLHVVTRKGKGYDPAESQPCPFHGTPPFDIATGSKKSGSGPTYTQIFGQALVDLAREDERIVAITAAMADGTGLSAFARAYPDRFFDVGIAEQHGVTFAAGLATQGYRPVVSIYSTFLQRAFDQIVHDVCLQNLPVTFCLDRAGLVGEDGPTHHGLFDLAYLRALPRMVVMAPKDGDELRRLLKTALAHPGPAALRYPRGAAPAAPGTDASLEAVPLGTWEMLREGTDVCFLAVGPLVASAQEAAQRLAAQGWSVGVVNCRFIKPLDHAMLRSLCARVDTLVTVEDHVLAGGFGSAVLEFLEQEDGARIPRVLRVGIPDTFPEHGTQAQLRQHYGLDAEGLERFVREALEISPSSPR